jgi:hypothetical protein
MANSLDRVKSWLSPMIISGFGFVLWSLLQEIRSDVKVLLQAEAATNIKIENLERRMTVTESMLAQNRLFAIKPEEIEIPKANRTN